MNLTGFTQTTLEGVQPTTPPSIPTVTLWTQSTHTLGGLVFHLYHASTWGQEKEEVMVVVCLHWRTGTAKSMQAVTECLASFSPTTCAFLTLDLQNHGDRCLNPLANLDFKAGNPHHAWDMYAIQCGSQSDISMILDYFPILFPQFTQIHWGVYGISLGAHVALQCMAKDSRFECCVSMLGCPDYAQLMRHRLPPSLDLPPTLLHLLQHHDPIHHIPSFGSSSSVHRWVGLCMGRLDPCVPLSCVTSFIQSVNEHTRSLSSTTIEGTSRFHVWIDDVAKHTCTKPLVEGSLQTLKQWWKELEKRNPTPTE